LGGKQPGSLDAPNLQSFPHNHEQCNNDVYRLKMRQLWNYSGKLRADLITEFAYPKTFVGFTELWYTKGITFHSL
jgi:hypothetical protein